MKITNHISGLFIFGLGQKIKFFFGNLNSFFIIFFIRKHTSDVNLS